MTTIPPPYSSRDHAQVQPVPLAQASTSTSSSVSQGQEFQETTSVCLEWRLSGLKAMYESTRGEQKSKCVKSAVFGDADNLWEVLWYPNAGTSTQTAGDHVSLYLSCVPTAQERESSIQNKWVRKGLWWFKFEIRPISNNSTSDTRTSGSSSNTTNRPGVYQHEALASKDASDHTFAVKTANWGWQAFAKRDTLFQNPQVLQSDSFIIICTIQAQSQPPAGLWLGIGLQPSSTTQNNIGGGGLLNHNGGKIGSGGGLSAWSTLDGSAGGVAGGTSAAGGIKRVVPKELISSVGSMLDDPLYSDVEFVIPAKRGTGSAPRRIYANKKLLKRCDYFQAMFHGGFKEVEGVSDDDESEDDVSVLSDSDMDEESLENESSTTSFDEAKHDRLIPSDDRDRDLHLTTTTSRNSSIRKSSTSADKPLLLGEDRSENDTSTSSSSENVNNNNTNGTKEENSIEVGNVTIESEGGGDSSKKSPLKTKETKSPTANTDNKSTITTSSKEMSSKRKTVKTPKVTGPKKTRVVIRDAAWSTWWAVLYWIYTDIIYFAPLTSSFEHQISRRQSTTSTTNIGNIEDPKTRSEWIHRWMIEHGIDSPPPPRPPRSSVLNENDEDPDTENESDSEDDDDDDYDSDDELTVGPRPVSAKAVYRLADKLDLPSLKLRSFQHICSGLTSGNVPAEVFSKFSSTYEDVRKVQVAFFLKHWSEIKKSETMTQIWQQIRNGKHVGFEEVWPLIVGQLDFRPS
ncbi:uncharacterized protein L201_002129 [Kwoniella dendrophila CBS 6074]|uniref:MATH domain-containing protein n=1 Tax=Kwoniella dendrophila CBS 6074 TaxID=1295534 RepID=A0AAX4JPB1_9TREE